MSKEKQVLFHFLSELVGTISPEELRNNKRLIEKVTTLFKQLSTN